MVTVEASCLLMPGRLYGLLPCACSRQTSYDIVQHWAMAENACKAGKSATTLYACKLCSSSWNADRGTGIEQLHGSQQGSQHCSEAGWDIVRTGLEGAVSEAGCCDQALAGGTASAALQEQHE